MNLQLPHGRLDFPVFLPDATLAVVRTVDSRDLRGCGIQALMMNAFHLMQKPAPVSFRHWAACTA